MFKVLILQTSHSLCDERTEYLMTDRLSFMRFLGQTLAYSAPDANTIWTFREALTKAMIDGKPAFKALIAAFDEVRCEAGFLVGRMFTVSDKRSQWGVHTRSLRGMGKTWLAPALGQKACRDRSVFALVSAIKNLPRKLPYLLQRPPNLRNIGDAYAELSTNILSAGC